MDERFPELTSFGTLLKYALALEEVAQEVYGALSTQGEYAQWHDAFAEAANRHRKRHKQMERYRKERLNEVVLQPITGMDRDAYLPKSPLPEEVTAALQTVRTLEEQSGRFYDDAVTLAAHVLGGLDKTFRKLAEENRTLAATLS